LQDLRICLHLDIHLCGWLIILALEDLALHAGLPQAFACPRGEHLIKCLQLAHQGTQPLTQGLREGEVPEELSGLRDGQLRGGRRRGQGRVQILKEGVHSAAQVGGEVAQLGGDDGPVLGELP
jgi:hypothetical protein